MLLWKLLTWLNVWCSGIFCKRISVHSIPRQFHTQWRKGQILGTERPSQSCQSIGKKILICRLRQKLLLSSVPEFPFSPWSVRIWMKKEKDAGQASRWQLMGSLSALAICISSSWTMVSSNIYYLYIFWVLLSGLGGLPRARQIPSLHFHS